MAKTPGLFLREGMFYGRKRVPLDLRGVLGKSEIKRSLKTSDRDEAKAARNRMAVELDEMFKRIRAERAGTCNINDRRIASLSMDEIRTRINFGVQAETKIIIDELNTLNSETEREYRVGEALELLEAYRHEDNQQAFNDRRLLKKQIFGSSLNKQHLTPKESEKIEALLSRALIETQQRELNTLLRRSHKKSFDEEFDTPDHEIVSLGEIADQYLADYKRTHRRISPKRMKKAEVAIEFIKEYFGSETDIRLIIRAQCREFRDRLNEMPSNMRKHYPDRNMTLAEIITAAKRDGKAIMKYETQESYIRPLFNLMKWAEAEQHISSNPAEDLHSLAEREPAKESRDPFTIEDLKKIFDAPLFRGCQNDAEGYAKPGDARPKGKRFWIIVIALYSGMRLNEICQLDIADIRVSPKGNLFFDINKEEGKRIKNSRSKREVPVHPILLRMGFKTFLQIRKASGDRKLFPSLKISRDGYLSERMSRWFNEGLLKSVGIKTKKLVFHSLRHNVKDAMRAAEIPLDIQDEIGGWRTIKGVSQNYGKGYLADKLLKYVSKIEYEGLDLTHLLEN